MILQLLFHANAADISGMRQHTRFSGFEKGP